MNKYLYKTITLLLFAGLVMSLEQISKAQTCSCAGPPLLSSQDIASTSAGNLLVGLTFDYHNISDLYSGSHKLRDDTFRRYTKTLLLETDYGLTDRITLTALLAWVQKKRNTTVSQTTGGPGDASLMFKYTLHKNTFTQQYELTLGGGVKIPVGSSRLKDNDIQYQADMQPGTGAWGLQLWGHASKTFLPASTINAFAIVSYQMNGSNHRYQNSDFRYRFGNVFTGTAGLSDKIGAGFQLTLMLRYRRASRDQINTNNVASTGGEWFNIVPGLNYRLTDNLMTRLSGQLPAWRNVNNTQPTTRFTASVSLFYSFQRTPFSF